MSENNQTWQDVINQADVKAMLTGIGLEPIDCYETMLEGVWEAVYPLTSAPMERELEEAGYAVLDMDDITDEGGQSVTLIRFRLPDAKAAPEIAPRYYIKYDPSLVSFLVLDSQRVDEEEHEHIIEGCFQLKQVAEAFMNDWNVRAAELNAANAPKSAVEATEAPIPPEHPALTKLKALRVDELSPMEALTKLYELKRMATQE